MTFITCNKQSYLLSNDHNVIISKRVFVLVNELTHYHPSEVACKQLFLISNNLLKYHTTL